MANVYDAEKKVTVNVLNKEFDLGLMIDSYGNTGFRLNNGVFVMGPMAIFSKSVLCWNVRTVIDITPESLSAFYLLEPKLDILVIGVGNRGDKLSPQTVEYLRSKKLGFEILPSSQACSTFNFLNSEQRYVAAAIIPPTNVALNLDEEFDAGYRRQRNLRLYEE
ncbi:hypothetical protein QYM36_005511 [Artemia franciscana]|uniref:NADH dehydrogenase [ubiquinone] 1 alpha subcomplex assembly factor 3 n=2 Tax=Artemia franciscana TaxID=6661 RepID=A0AA88L9T7_ARTSF|nr:hypothetical protein QYM36_005511 [Artemia franciscana]